MWAKQTVQIVGTANIQKTESEATVSQNIHN